MGKSVMTYKGEFIAAMEAKGIKYTDKDKEDEEEFSW